MKVHDPALGFDLDTPDDLEHLDTIRLLEQKGHTVVVGATFGSANSILVAPEGFTGAADPRQAIMDITAGLSHIPAEARI